MANALRNLQIFRNGAIITGKTVAEIKTLIDSALVAGTLTLNDGEPINIRYQEGGDVKGLMGVAYINGDDKKVLWNECITIETSPKEDAFVTLNHTEDGNGNVTLKVAATTVSLTAATAENDGLATAKDVKDYIDTLSYKEYEIVKMETAEDGYLATYELHDENGAKAGASINIPKDFLVKSGEVKTVTEAGKPYADAVVGDKYIDFVINVKQGTATDEHIYLPVKDLVDVYTAGDGLTLGANNTFAVNYANEGHNVTFAIENGKLVADAVDTTYAAGENITITGDANVIAVKVSEAAGNALTSSENGLYATDTTYTGSNSIAISANNEISVKISSHEGNIIGIDENGIWAVQGASVTITDVKVIKNDTENTKYYTVDENYKIVETETETTKTMSIEPGTKKILVATSDGHLNGDVLPETEDTYVDGGELVDIPATETEAAKTVIRLSYNTGINPIDVDVTALVNSAHTEVEGETVITGANTDYVYVHAETNDNVVTLTSGVKTVAINEAHTNGLNYIGHGQTVTLQVGDVITDIPAALTGVEGITISTDEITILVNGTPNTRTKEIYVTAANLSIINGIEVKAYEVSRAFEANDGLVTAVDVKNYIDSHETIVTSNNQSVTITPSTNAQGAKVYDLAVSVEHVGAAVVTETHGAGTTDTMTVTATGTLNQNVIDAIESYIDHYDCGTFDAANINPQTDQPTD